MPGDAKMREALKKRFEQWAKSKGWPNSTLEPAGFIAGTLGVTYKSDTTEWAFQAFEHASLSQQPAADVGRLLAAVEALGKRSGFNGMTYFETPILNPTPENIGAECMARWRELNDAVAATRNALAQPHGDGE